MESMRNLHTSRTRRRRTFGRALASAFATGALVLAAAGLWAQPLAPEAGEPSAERLDRRSNSRAMTLLEAVESRTNLSVFQKYVEAGELTEYLDGSGSYTILAPSNAAFAYLEPSALKSWERIRRFVLRHVVSGRQSAAELAERGYVSTLRDDQGRRGFKVETDDEGRLVIGGVAWVVEQNIQTENGVIHVVSRFLPDPDAGRSR